MCCSGLFVPDPLGAINSMSTGLGFNSPINVKSEDREDISQVFLIVFKFIVLSLPGPGMVLELKPKTQLFGKLVI